MNTQDNEPYYDDDEHISVQEKKPQPKICQGKCKNRECACSCVKDKCVKCFCDK